MEKWQRRTFLKRLRVWLQEIGFKPSKVSKLITAGEFMAAELKNIEGITYEQCFLEDVEQVRSERLEYLHSYGVSGLYQIARMNWKGQAQARNSYAASEGKPQRSEILRSCKQNIQLRTQEEPLVKPNRKRVSPR